MKITSWTRGHRAFYLFGLCNSGWKHVRKLCSQQLSLSYSGGAAFNPADGLLSLGASSGFVQQECDFKALRDVQKTLGCVADVLQWCSSTYKVMRYNIGAGGEKKWHTTSGHRLHQPHVQRRYSHTLFSLQHTSLSAKQQDSCNKRGLNDKFMKRCTSPKGQLFNYIHATHVR